MAVEFVVDAGFVTALPVEMPVEDAKAKELHELSAPPTSKQ